MDYFYSIIDFFLHLDKHLDTIVSQYGNLSYLILFLVIFCETGLVFTPFLPGDSLLFATGAIGARAGLSYEMLLGLLVAAAVLGDTVNYHIGYFFGDKILKKGFRIIKPQYIEKTSSFYEKYGAKTIVIARFVPLVRTFAPFMAGVAKMSYKKFLFYNVAGGFCWVFLFLTAGYKFGELEFVKKNFSLLILAIIFVSILPAIWEYFKAKRISKIESTESEDKKL